jgi:hypothetical protein
MRSKSLTFYLQVNIISTQSLLYLVPISDYNQIMNTLTDLVKNKSKSKISKWDLMLLLKLNTLDLKR